MKKLCIYLLIVIMANEANFEAPPPLDQPPGTSPPDQNLPPRPTTPLDRETLLTESKPQSDLESQPRSELLDNPELPGTLVTSSVSVPIPASEQWDANAAATLQSELPTPVPSDQSELATDSRPNSSQDESEPLESVPFELISSTDLKVQRRKLEGGQDSGVIVFPDDARITAKPTTTTKSPYNQFNDEVQETTTQRKPGPQPEKVQECIRRCPVTPEYNPVCGTDYVSYTNPSRLNCAKTCGVDVSIMRKGRCPTTTTSTTSRITTRSTTASSITPSPSIIRECTRNCPVTSEYNPVCGTDYVTYDNPGRLSCAKMCGVDVSIMRLGRCSATTTSTTTSSITTTRTTTRPITTTRTTTRPITTTRTTARPITTTRTPPITSTTTESSEVAECMQRCPESSEYNPVCGTDYVMYRNPGRLNCAYMCGVPVKIMRKGRCPERPAT